jgi:hypothetical protein
MPPLLERFKIWSFTARDSDDERDKTQQPKCRSRYMRVLPTVTQLSPIRRMSFVPKPRPIRSEREKARTKAVKIFALNPKLIDRMREEPVHSLHTDES